MPDGFETETVWQARGRGFQMGVIQPQEVTAVSYTHLTLPTILLV